MVHRNNCKPLFDVGYRDQTTEAFGASKSYQYNYYIKWLQKQCMRRCFMIVLRSDFGLKHLQAIHSRIVYARHFVRHFFFLHFLLFYHFPHQYTQNSSDTCRFIVGLTPPEKKKKKRRFMFTFLAPFRPL